MTADPDNQSDACFIEEFLQGTSRTFALAIPLLVSIRRQQVGLSYLLFRVADSIEDAPETDAFRKTALLRSLKSCFETEDQEGQQGLCARIDHAPDLSGLWPDQSPTGRLLLEFPRLMEIFNKLPVTVSLAVRQALSTTTAGMINFINASAESPNQIQIQTVSDLKLYCYAVAGIVGELMTDLFVFHHPSGLVVHQELRSLATGFGEFLQLINILKDTRFDAANGRVFIPVETSRENIHELALQGRRDALMYIRFLERHDFPIDIILFCRFLFLLADGSLQKLKDGGAGSKLTRQDVQKILADVRSETSVLPV
ncbi:MAG: squalene/phytoene synthase family protein [Planctomyces sp.]|jgi:farnesyl-diphosphate farnesyltransferase